MREIKFRAWDKNEKKVLDVLLIDWLNDFVDLENGRIEREFDEVVLLQFTGLKDKNGIEIYENDIITNFDKEGEYYQVIWDDDAAMFVFWSRLERYSDDFYSLDNEGQSPNDMVVVGNIYENPELLEDSK